MAANFEVTFREFVREFGGTILPEGSEKSADFHFASDDIIAELKTLEQEVRQEHGKHIQALWHDWTRRRLVLGYGTFQIALERLPAICQQEWLDILQPPVENIIRKANAQIRSTKESRNSPSSKGLLLIANEGNLLHTSPKDYMILVARVLSKLTQERQRRFPYIDGVVYFSYRIRTQREGLPFWIAGYTKQGGDPPMTTFQERLKLGWYSYLSKTNGGVPIWEVQVKPE